MMGARERRSNYQCLKLEILIACLVANLSSGYVVNGLPFSQPSSFTDSTPPWTAYPTRAQRRSQMQQQNQDEADEENVFSSLSERAGNAALDNVQMLASKVAESTGGSRTISSNSPRGYLRQAKARISKSDSATPGGTGGLVYNNKQYSTINKEEGGQSTAASAAPTTKESSSVAADLQVSPSSNKEDQVWTALANLELDMQMLDVLAGQRPQLTALEFAMLSLTVVCAASGPLILNGALTEFLAPTAAAFSAAIGIGAEYVGKVNVADGKEIAAATIQCAAEAEGLLANGERSKAIAPLCVGVGASATAFALLVPALLDSFGQVVLNEIYLGCPLVSVLAAAVASLALQETKFFCSRATSVGNRRWAKSGSVGRTWLSTSEQIMSKSTSGREKWKTFSLSVLPAPIIGAMIPGASLPAKAIIITAFAAAQSAFYLAYCEYWLARATDAVAVKARSAAVCDTYANQGARSAAILPFTSALSGLCAAATAAIVELPFVEALSAAGTASGVAGEIAAVSVFPTLSAMFAAAASVSKARCEVHAEAASAAASTLALEYSEGEDPILRPFKGVWELIQLSYTTTIVEPIQRFVKRIKKLSPYIIVKRWFQRKKKENTLRDDTDATPAIA